MDTTIANIRKEEERYRVLGYTRKEVSKSDHDNGDMTYELEASINFDSLVDLLKLGAPDLTELKAVRDSYESRRTGKKSDVPVSREVDAWMELFD
jgi:hypothetical protein